MLNDVLEIILITYNRKKQLGRTLEQLFAENSPVKNMDITILDNKSTDGSSELIADYARRFPNVKHVRHNRNIGGVANSIRAFELASKKYLWVLCDDDRYDWSNWAAVEAAIARDEDAIVVSRYCIPDDALDRLENIVLQLTFLPACIYKTTVINDEVLRNAYNNLQTLLPQCSFAIALVNDKKSFCVLEKDIVLRSQLEPVDETHNRGNDLSKLARKTRAMSWIAGYATMCSNLRDHALKNRTMLAAINFKEIHNGFENFCEFMAVNYPAQENWDLVLTVFQQLDDASQRMLLKRFIEIQTNFVTDSKKIYDYFLQFGPEYESMFTLPNGQPLTSRKVYSITLDDGTRRTISVYDTLPPQAQAS